MPKSQPSSYYIAFGQETCPYCQKLKAWCLRNAKSLQDKVIYVDLTRDEILNISEEKFQTLLPAIAKLKETPHGFIPMVFQLNPLSDQVEKWPAEVDSESIYKAFPQFHQ